MGNEQEKSTISSSSCASWLYRFMRYKTAVLWHPEGLGTKVTVKRSWIGRLLKPVAFATFNETLKEGVEWRDL